MLTPNSVGRHITLDAGGGLAGGFLGGVARSVAGARRRHTNAAHRRVAVGFVL